MLDYIRSQINARVNENAVKTPAAEDIPNDVIVEYAHIFQELDDVSIEGAEVDKARKMSLDIPFEDEDVEIDNIEFNLNDGRVTDVPGDASVQEAYADIKTYEKFYQETYDETTRLPRETDGMFEKRVAANAAKKYAEYCETAMEQGLFGFDDISVTDSRVPSKMNVDFGSVDEKDDSKSFFGKVKTFFATDKDHNIKKHQLDSVNLVKNGAFSKIGKPLMAYMESKYDVPTGSSVWDVVTPMNLYVPRNNGDSFCVVLEYMNELTNKKEYFGWTRPVNEDDLSSIENMEKLNMESFVNETHYENHDVVVQEAAMRDEVSKKRTYSRFYQEAIDFGGADGGDSNDAGSDLPPTDDSTDTPDDSSANTSNDDPTVDTGNASDAPESNDDSSTGDDSDKEQAVVNDVSQQIAEKVADQTKADAQDDSSTDDGTSVSFDDDDMNTGDDTTEGNASIDDQINDLDNTTSDDDSMNDDMDDDTTGDVDTSDFDNMTIDQLIEQGSEKLKGMTLQEIKDFINSGDADAVQEAFILTKKNINQEVDNNIRACLGLLNDNKMDLDKIVRKFKFSGHKLNRTLTKAIKMKDVYSSNEVKDLQKLNKSLVDLMTSLRKSKDNTYVAQIKNNIRVFVSQCKVVSDFIEDKIKGGTMNAIQEGFFITKGNVKSKLAKVLVPVHGNMKEIEKLADAEKLTRGRIVKMYNNPGYIHSMGDVSTSTTNSSIGSSGRYGMFRGADAANNLDEAIKLLNRIIRKKANVIDEATFETVNSLADDLDVFGDYVETVIDDKNENKSAVKFIGKQAKKIIGLINELVDIDEDDVKNNLPEEDIISDTNPSVDDVNDDTSIEDTSSEDPEFDEGESDSDVDIPDETSEDENEDTDDDDDSSSEEDED